MLVLRKDRKWQIALRHDQMRYIRPTCQANFLWILYNKHTPIVIWTLPIANHPSVFIKVNQRLGLSYAQGSFALNIAICEPNMQILARIIKRAIKILNRFVNFAQSLEWLIFLVINRPVLVEFENCIETPFSSLPPYGAL